MQEGSVIREHRKLGPDVWCYRWWEAGSTIRVTLDTYTQAVTTEKRAAQTAVVRLFVGKKGSKPPQEEADARLDRSVEDADSRC